MNRKKSLLIEEIVYWVILLAIGMGFVSFYKTFLFTNYDNVCHRLFAERLFNTSLEDMVEYYQNMPVHAITYPLYHISLKVLARLHNWDYFWASYVVLTVVNILSMALFRKLIHVIYKTEKIVERIGINLVSIGAILFVVARSPLTDWRFYDVQCAANPLHNPTILFARPFGIVAFIAFAFVMMKSVKGEKYGIYLALFSGSMFLSILAKPNFAFVFLPAMGLVVLIYMIHSKKLKMPFQLLGVLVPSLVLLVWQFTYVSSSTSAMKLQVVVGGFTGMNLSEVIFASLATFPVVLILFSAKDFKENIFYRTSILALVIGWLQMFLLTNGPSGDFSWGYDLAVQFATVTSVACTMSNSTAKWRKYLGYFAFAYQVFCGIQYIVLVNNYGEFLI